MAFLYILRCGDGSYYVGSTRSLHRRVDAHMMGKGAAYTRARLPVTLLWHEEFESIGDAYWWEKRVQNWSRAKREALMRAFEASGKTEAEFADMYGMAPKEVASTLARARIDRQHALAAAQAAAAAEATAQAAVEAEAAAQVPSADAAPAEAPVASSADGADASAPAVDAGKPDATAA